jgi:hypothetical protein
MTQEQHEIVVEKLFDIIRRELKLLQLGTDIMDSMFMYISDPNAQVRTAKKLDIYNRTIKEFDDLITEMNEIINRKPGFIR